MTGWTQFTARLSDESDATALQQNIESADIRTSYNETFENIARARFVGYDMRDDAIAFLSDKGAGPIVELALVATFNDTSDSGHIEVYTNEYSQFLQVTEVMCPEASRWDFRLELDGLVETGLRAGNDFSLEEEYGDANRQAVPLEEMEHISDEVVDVLKLMRERA